MFTRRARLWLFVLSGLLAGFRCEIKISEEVVRREEITKPVGWLELKGLVECIGVTSFIDVRPGRLRNPTEPNPFPKYGTIWSAVSGAWPAPVVPTGIPAVTNDSEFRKQLTRFVKSPIPDDLGGSLREPERQAFLSAFVDLAKVETSGDSDKIWRQWQQVSGAYHRLISTNIPPEPESPSRWSYIAVAMRSIMRSAKFLLPNALFGLGTTAAVAAAALALRPHSKRLTGWLSQTRQASST